MIIMLHSYKGGTGKTLLSVNLATLFAMSGKRVCLLDLDLRAPSLCSIFKSDKAYWVNDYLNRSCEIDRVLVKYAPKGLTKGELFVGLANPSVEAIREISSKDREWELKALGRLLSLKTALLTDMHLDYLILDTSPGLQYSSINALVTADVVLVVMTMEESDVEGTNRMICELYELFEKKTGIIVNKIPNESLPLKTWKGRFRNLETDQLPIIGAVPCSCDVLKAAGQYIFASEKTDHPFMNTLRRIAKEIEYFTQEPVSGGLNDEQYRGEIKARSARLVAG